MSRSIPDSVEKSTYIFNSNQTVLPMSTVEEIQTSQAENLMAVLQIEMNVEASRQERLAQCRDPEELEAMEELFDAQRLASKNRLALMAKKNKQILNMKVKKIVKHKKVADRLENFPADSFAQGQGSFDSSFQTVAEASASPQSKTTTEGKVKEVSAFFESGGMTPSPSPADFFIG